MSNNIIYSDRGSSGSDGGHNLINLTYVSRAEGAVDGEALKSILASAQESNRLHGVTGVLLFNRQFFLQTIEGSRPAINQLLTNLINDKRHFDLQIIESIQIAERQWDQWAMAYATPTEKNQSLFLKYSAGKDFNPYLMTASSIYKLLHAMARKTPVAQSKPAQQKKQSTGIMGKLLRRANHV